MRSSLSTGTGWSSALWRAWALDLFLFVDNDFLKKVPVPYITIHLQKYERIQSGRIHASPIRGNYCFCAAKQPLAHNRRWTYMSDRSVTRQVYFLLLSGGHYEICTMVYVTNEMNLEHNSLLFFLHTRTHFFQKTLFHTQK